MLKMVAIKVILIRGRRVDQGRDGSWTRFRKIKKYNNKGHKKNNFFLLDAKPFISLLMDNSATKEIK